MDTFFTPLLIPRMMILMMKMKESSLLKLLQLHHQILLLPFLYRQIHHQLIYHPQLPLFFLPLVARLSLPRHNPDTQVRVLPNSQTEPHQIQPVVNCCCRQMATTPTTQILDMSPSHQQTTYSNALVSFATASMPTLALVYMLVITHRHLI